MFFKFGPLFFILGLGQANVHNHLKKSYFVKEVLAFYESHRPEIDASIRAEEDMEEKSTEAEDWPGQVRWLKDWADR